MRGSAFPVLALCAVPLHTKIILFHQRSGLWTHLPRSYPLQTCSLTWSRGVELRARHEHATDCEATLRSSLER
ncbi:hypothetical protein P692DRAFT_20131461 [Suillus brevipes Sb2]|nr:hypothetical protein P692DRAFT_20131461 [Suillus brevipes Sb2]